MNFRHPFFLLLPRYVRLPMLRRWIDLPLKINPELHIRVCRSKDDFLKAFHILYECYRESGSESSHPSHLRITPYHLLPSTAILLAELNGKAIGTLSMIRQSGFGMPISPFYNLNSLTQKSERLAEISSLAILKTFRGHHGEILFPLFKFMLHYCVTNFDVQKLLISIRLFRRDFYEGLLEFQPIDNNVVPSYEFANGATVIGEYLNLENLNERLTQYKNLSPSLIQMKKYFDSIPPKEFDLPKNPTYLVHLPLLSYDTLKVFFDYRPDLRSKLSHQQKLYFAHLYKYDGAILDLLELNRKKIQIWRSSPRWEISSPAWIQGQKKIRITEISNLGGQGVLLEEGVLNAQEQLLIKTDLNPKDAYLNQNVSSEESINLRMLKKMDYDFAPIDIKIIKQISSHKFVFKTMQPHQHWQTWYQLISKEIQNHENK